MSYLTARTGRQRQRYNSHLRLVSGDPESWIHVIIRKMRRISYENDLGNFSYDSEKGLNEAQSHHRKSTAVKF
ncbi:hypothetical protein ACFX15_016106 [Malus domestica]